MATNVRIDWCRRVSVVFLLLVTGCQPQEGGRIPMEIESPHEPKESQGKFARNQRSGPLPFETGAVHDLAITPDGQNLVWEEFITNEGKSKLSICVWSLQDWRLLHRLPINKRISAWAFSPCGKMLAISFSEGTIQLWNTATWKQQVV